MKCPVCKKEFDVLWPSQWAYKREEKFICSWGCIRKYDKRKEADRMKKRVTLTGEQRTEALDMALRGENPLPYLKKCGAANPTSAWRTMRKWAMEHWDKATAGTLPESFGPQRKDLEPEEEVEAEWTPAEEVYPKEEPKIELVYDESIAEEYRREQEAKKAAEDPLVYEIPIRKERVNIGPARLPIASVWSRAMEMGTFTKVQGIGMMLKDPECQILMSRAKWEELADEIRVALEMLEV